MKKVYDNVYNQLTIDDAGMTISNKDGNQFFPYGSIVSIKITGIGFLSQLEVKGRNRNFFYTLSNKAERNEIKDLIPFIEEKMRTSAPVDAMDNVASVGDSSSLMGLDRNVPEVVAFLDGHKKAKDIVTPGAWNGFDKIDTYKAEDLFNKYNARFVFTFFSDPSWKRESCVIITTNMVYLRNGADGKETFYIGKDMCNFVSRLNGNKQMGSTFFGKAYDKGARDFAVSGIRGECSPDVYKILVSSKLAKDCPIIAKYKDNTAYREFAFSYSVETSAGQFQAFCEFLEKQLKLLGGSRKE